jgi:novobiocin biosynthesis protein NovU/D-mycarose 3-C-methyltransferase
MLVLDLGEQPLANDLREPGAPAAPRYPLRLLACPDCKLGQLSHVVSPTVLYSRYVYYSGANPAWHAHCASLCDALGPLDGKLVLDVASNDGTFLAEADRRGARTLGVEPARNFALCGYPVIAEYWGATVASRDAVRGKVDVLTACNVLGHVDDAHDFMEGVRLALASDGRAVIEVPTLGQLLATNAFDTIYHEHLSYWSVTAVQRLALLHELKLLHVEPIAVHASSRFWLASTGKADHTVWTALRAEGAGLPKDQLANGFAMWREQIRRTTATIDGDMTYCDAAYGAAAKTAVLYGQLSVYPPIIYDDSPHKHGKLVPGTDVVIQPTPASLADVTTLAITAWNWAPQLMERARGLGFRGRFYVPLPEPRWIDA